MQFRDQGPYLEHCYRCACSQDSGKMQEHSILKMQNYREKSDVTTRFQGLVSRLVPRGVASDTSGTTPGSRSARDYGNMSYVNGRLVSVWHEGMAVAGAMCDCPIRNRRKLREQRAKAWRKWRGLPGLWQSGKKHSILKMQSHREQRVPSSKVFCHPPFFLWQNTPRGLS